MSGAEIREAINSLISMPRSLEEARNAKRFFGWLDLLSVEVGRSHLLQADAFVSEFQQLLGAESFEELEIPMQVVAADFWNREEVVFDSGPIAPAVAASFCLPGVFKPVVIEEKVLVDGGCVNPVPFDLIRDRCDILIAVDVLGKRVPDDDLMPSYTEALFNTFQIAEKNDRTTQGADPSAGHLHRAGDQGRESARLPEGRRDLRAIGIRVPQDGHRTRSTAVIGLT